MEISIENSNRLLWLGRYSERVYTTLKFFADQFDAMIDGGKELYGGYTSRGDFAKKYCFDESNSSSVSFGLMRAYDNAIELRREIGSDAFSYIQMAVYEMSQAEKSEAPLLALQKVVDDIAAFWGIADDAIDDEKIRSIIKLGKRLERVDLYARLKAPDGLIRREILRLSSRLPKTGLKYHSEPLEKLLELANEEKINHQAVINEAEKILDTSIDRKL